MSVSTLQKQSLEEATLAYAAQIDAAAGYLRDRGLTKEVAVTRRLGVVVDPLVGHEKYRGRLAIPYLTPSGVVDLRFRSMNPDDDGPKYLSRPGVEARMYGVLAFQQDSDIIAICEGEFDSIVLHDLCGIPAVGIPGAQAWKSYYWRAFEDYRKVFVFADGDTPGQEFAGKIAGALDVAVTITMPDGQDVNSVYLAEGPEGIRKRMGL